MKQLTGQDENSSKNGADGETDGCLASLSSSASSAEGDRKTVATGKMVGCHLGGRSISCVGQRGKSKLSSGSPSSCHGRDDYSKKIEAEVARACPSATMAAVMVIGEERKEEGKGKREEVVWLLKKVMKPNGDDYRRR